MREVLMLVIPVEHIEGKKKDAVSVSKEALMQIFERRCKAGEAPYL